MEKCENILSKLFLIFSCLDVQSSLSSMAEWLNFNNRDEFMNVYAVVRSQCMKRSLESLRDHSRTLSAGNSR